MKFIRKSLGLFIIIFMALPVLFGVIWSAGLIKATTSPYFLSELPKEVIDRLPSVVREATDIVKTAEGDAGIKTWMAASEKAGVNWEKVMEESGVLNWLNEEVKSKATRLGDMFEGNRRLEDISLNITPLKNALRHDSIYIAIGKVLENLPEGTESQIDEWSEYISAEGRKCMPFIKPPDVDVAVSVIKTEMYEEIDDMEDHVKLVNVGEFAPYGQDLLKFFNDIMFLMFLIPTVFILLGSFIGGYGLRGFLKWSGISTLIGGILTLISVKLVQGVVALSSWLPSHFDVDVSEEFIRVRSVMFDKLEELFTLIVDAIFDPVGQVAKLVCIVGIVLWAVSFAVADSREEVRAIKS